MERGAGSRHHRHLSSQPRRDRQPGAGHGTGGETAERRLRRRGWSSRASSRSPASIRSTRSSGSCASAVIGNERGEVVFEQRDVEIPKSWSQQATNIVVSKYFRGQIGTPERERSVKQLIGRVVDTITDVGARGQVLRERRAICRRSATI